MNLQNLKPYSKKHSMSEYRDQMVIAVQDMITAPYEFDSF